MSEKEMSRIQINGDLYHLSDNDTREQIVSLSGKLNDLSNFKLSGGIIPLNIKHLSGETIQLSNDYNCYCLTPSATLNLQFDTSNVSEFDGGEFYLMVDFTNGIQTINFPDTFTWKQGTSAPSINSETLYIFKCTYLYTDPIAYVGEFITSIINRDYDKGLWFLNEDDSIEEGYDGIIYLNEDINVNPNQKLIVSSGEFNNLNLLLDLMPSDEYEYFARVEYPKFLIKGGIFNSINYKVKNTSGNFDDLYDSEILELKIENVTFKNDVSFDDEIASSVIYLQRCNQTNFNKL